MSVSSSAGSAYDDFLNSQGYDNTTQAAVDIASKIGTGHKEADVIVPYANALGTLLDQVNIELRSPAVTVSRLHQLREILVAKMNDYQNILAGPWKDGRAARQGYETMFGIPGYARLTLENLDKLLVERSGGGAPAGLVETVTGALGGGNNLALAGLAVGAFLMFKK